MILYICLFWFISGHNSQFYSLLLCLSHSVLFRTPQGRAPNLTNLEAAARCVAKISRSPKVVVEKSTVPIKAAETVTRILNMSTKKTHMNGKNGIIDGHFVSTSLLSSLFWSAYH